MQQRQYYTVNDFEFHPPPYRKNGIPVWVGGLAGRGKPLRRAARYNGYVTVNLTHPDQLAEAIAAIRDARRHIRHDTYDFVVGLPPETDPQPFARAAQRGGY